MNNSIKEESVFTVSQLISTLQGLGLPDSTKVLLYDDDSSTIDTQHTRGITRIDSGSDWIILD